MGVGAWQVPLRMMQWKYKKKAYLVNLKKQIGRIVPQQSGGERCCERIQLSTCHIHNDVCGRLDAK